MAVWWGNAWKLVVVAVVVAAAGGCGENEADGGGAASSDVVRMLSVSSESGDSETIEVIAEASGRYRLTVVSGPDAGVFQVWDGKALLMHLPDDSPQYQRFENPDRNEVPVATWFYQPDSDEFRKFCPGAKKLGTKTLFDRTAARYHCDETVPSETDPTEPQAAREIALDEKTGLIMADGTDTPTEVTFGAETKPDTFSTEVPPGEDEFSTEEPPGGDEEETHGIYPAELPAVGGGFINTALYATRPYVVVAGPADGIRATLGRVLPMTHDGKPAVVGFLFAAPGEDWKGSLLNPEDEKAFVDSVLKTVGTFPAPVGVDIKGATAASFASSPTDVTIALVTAAGPFAHVTPASEVSDVDLRKWIAELS
ncbi:hypothetical protein E0H75_37930 [Kribbella capetownensis]|uniref:Uncharacterized protein n=1 Tax=Kribbella capetownensis TaxID=1572659 RepID=A0A4R0JDS5_9ACTN|nr:hypothetical protein [Kribbella capetownensis]TCC42796.1 hypothetical protein E0H75_37930 [Kribbella capetownensis]